MNGSDLKSAKVLVCLNGWDVVASAQILPRHYPRISFATPNPLIASSSSIVVIAADGNDLFGIPPSVPPILHTFDVPISKDSNRPESGIYADLYYISQYHIGEYLSDDATFLSADEAFFKSSIDEIALSTISGLWYDPALNGMGFNILSASNGTMIYYYGYSQSGQRLWLHSDSQNTPWIQGTAKTITLYQSTEGNGANFNKPPSETNGVNAWGTLELQFDSCTTGKATLVGKDGTQIFTLTRLAGDKGLLCTIN